MTTLTTLIRSTVALVEGVLLALAIVTLVAAVVPENLTRINPVAAVVTTATGQA